MYNKIQVWLIFIQLINSTTTQQTASSLKLFIEHKPEQIFQTTKHSLQTFSLPIPDFISDQNAQLIQTISDKIKTMDIRTRFEEYLTTPGTQKNKNVGVCVKATTNILGNFNSTKKRLKEISKYKQPQNTANTIRKTICHADFASIYGIPTLKAYDMTIDVLLKSLNKDITLEQLTQVDGRDFKSFYQIVEQIAKATELLYQETENFLTAFKSLARLEMNNYISDLIYERECFRTGPAPDYFKIQECEFYTTNVTCLLQIQKPIEGYQLTKVLAVPYFGYEINLDNTYLNTTSNQLIDVKCKNNEPIKSECIIDTTNRCLKAVQLSFYHNVLKDCNFQKTKTTGPVLTIKGVLIPSDDTKIYRYDANNELQQLNLLQDKPMPALLDLSYTIVVIYQSYKYEFVGMSTTDNIQFSKLSEIQLKHLHKRMTAYFNIPEEYEQIIINSTVGGAATVLLVIVMTLCRKLYTKNRTLKETQRRLPREKYSREMMEFINKPNRRKSTYQSRN